MKFRILGHACMEIEVGGRTLLCDPWLVGSAYWRSWWNFPPTPKGLVDELNPDFIYISHLHWDHFHGPTLGRLGLNRRVLVPKTPDRRLIHDLNGVGMKNVEELEHGIRTPIGEDLVVTSYQIGPFADSALVIEAGGVTLLNANDAKFMGLPLRQILKHHKEIDFVFRSHSSANSRLCYRFPDAPEVVMDDLSKYSAEFAEFCCAVGAKYAIPFASNHCFLHDETWAYNKTVNFSAGVARYFATLGVESPKCVPMQPGDVWDSQNGFALTPAITDIAATLETYRDSKEPQLASQREKEARTVLALSGVTKHLQNIVSDTPWIIRRFFKNKPIAIVGHSPKGDRCVLVDLHANKVSEVSSEKVQECPIRIHASALIINDCCRTRNWNSLGISKRVQLVCPQRDAKILRLFNYVLNAHEYEIFPVKKMLNWRFLGVWVRRWRELTLYARITFDLLIGRGFQLRRYLPRPEHQSREAAPLTVAE
jgi:UDP-MurNAc hydroxylase